MTPQPPLSAAQVEHLAVLARLRLSPAQIESFREQLSSVLVHFERLASLDVEGVEPLAHPLDVVNRMDEDEVAESMPVEKLLEMAPSVEGRFLAVPKVGGTEGLRE